MTDEEILEKYDPKELLLLVLRGMEVQILSENGKFVEVENGYTIEVEGKKFIQIDT